MGMDTSVKNADPNMEESELYAKLDDDDHIYDDPDVLLRRGRPYSPNSPSPTTHQRIEPSSEAACKMDLGRKVVEYSIIKPRAEPEKENLGMLETTSSSFRPEVRGLVLNSEP